MTQLWFLKMAPDVSRSLLQTGVGATSFPVQEPILWLSKLTELVDTDSDL